MLVSSKIRDGTLWFEVHKEGLQFLRRFRNKRLRIIFNITHQSDTLQEFNAYFLNKGLAQNNNKCTKSNLSQMRISEYYEELSDNRVLIFLNAYQNPQTTHLLVLGYLVASVFFYHNESPLAQDSNLSTMLSGLRKFLSDTQIHRLQQQIKYKSGCIKKPYLMCLFQQGQKLSQNYHDIFRQFYKYKQGHNKLNESVDTLIDYFPERSALYIGDYRHNQANTEIIKKLGRQYIENILGRQIFNFQITGSSLQNLCFELCEVFNSKISSINLLEIYNKIINNQKTQVLDYSIEKYSGLINELAKGLPYEGSQLLQSYGRIQKYIMEECMIDASNCMIFSQYLPIYTSLSTLMGKRLKQIKDNNKELLRNRALKSFQAIDDEQFEKHIANLTQENSIQILQAIQQKFKLFMSENIHEYNILELLTRLLSKYLEQYRQSLSTIFKQKEQGQKQSNERINKLLIQNKTYQTKIKLLQSQYIYLNSISNEYKEKLLKINNSSAASLNDIAYEIAESGNVLEMRKKIMELEAEIVEKNYTIQYLSGILDKFEIEFNRKYFKPKFNKDIQIMLNQVTSKMNEMYQLFNELKKTEQFYKDIEYKLEQRKKDFAKERVSQKEELAQVKEKLNQAIKQRNLLEQILQQSRQSIKILKAVQKQDKDSINQLQNGCSRLKCLLAQIQGQFQKFKKALELVSYYCVTGKSQKLRDFIKVLNQQELKQILKPIFKR